GNVPSGTRTFRETGGPSGKRGADPSENDEHKKGAQKLPDGWRPTEKRTAPDGSCVTQTPSDRKVP
ncbi:MAG: hypothetical protein Q4C47_04090, partial [Planctomycetia bacterium]|nr:hypothetical protein [Planctomycetia bacterium]